MVARGLREQLELTRDLLTQGLGAIKEMEARLEARRQPLQRPPWPPSARPWKAPATA